MKTTDSKEKRIRTYLLSGHTLTKLEALNYFRHNNLGHIVFKMNKEKPGLIGKMWGTSRDKSRFAIYALSSLIKHRFTTSK